MTKNQRHKDITQGYQHHIKK